MASTDARPVPKKNVAYRHYFAIRKNDGTLITTWAGQDSELSADGASFADATAEATEIGTSGIGYIDLTAGEMNADCVVLKVTVTNTDALPYVVTLFPEEAGDIRVDAAQLGGSTQSATDLKDFADTGYDPSTHKVAGVVLADTTNELGTQAKADVNAEVLDVMATDTISEPSQGIPPATPSMKTLLAWFWMAFRNKGTSSTSEVAVYDDAGTKLAKAGVADDGTTFTKDEMTSGA